MRSFLLALLPGIALFARSPALAEGPKVEVRDGDRIVYLGNTFAERDGEYGYLETILTAANPDKTFTFRNLGWSGDTVWGDARARFGSRADGFQHLKQHVLALKPTLILVAYGMNESFAGEAGLPEFEAGLKTLLDTLGETKARIVLISPIQHENLGPPLPDPSAHNRDLARYVEAIRGIASARGCTFVDLFTGPIFYPSITGRAPTVFPLKKPDPDAPHDTPDPTAYPQVWFMTGDGLHPSPFGYWVLDHEIARQMEGRKLGDSHSTNWTMRISWSGTDREADRARFSEVHCSDQRLKVAVVPDRLPACLAPEDRPAKAGGPVMSEFGSLGFRDLPPGRFAISYDGQDPVFLTESNGGKSTLYLPVHREDDQSRALRAAINAKNELYFHRWRPQNETYLFGFRKHEQGNNAVEIPLFDPLVAEKEAEIARLKTPRPHSYELIRQGPAK